MTEYDPSTQRTTPAAAAFLPRLLIVDDVFGRQLRERPNSDRIALCRHLRLRDVTGDPYADHSAATVRPIAEAVFHRGQRPLVAGPGDTVENDLASVVDAVRSGWEGAGQAWSLVLLDLAFFTGPVTAASDEKQPGMPEGRSGDQEPANYFGLAILKRLRDDFPDLPIVILSSKPRDEVSLDFNRFGALGFIDRAERDATDKLALAIQQHGLIPDASGTIIGMSRSLLRVLSAVRRAAANDDNILIRGESGSGKEPLAAYVHAQTPKRRDKAFVPVNSGLLTGELAQSELFGHTKGAFTGAIGEKRGLIVTGDGGDIFFDEIGNMPSRVQDGLLRVLETKEVEPLGGGRRSQVNVRFIAATNADLDQMVAAGQFRYDLDERLRRGGTVFLPPLRERRADIPLLVDKFVRDAETAIGARRRQVDDAAIARLMLYDWPLNVRELRRSIFDAVTNYPDLEYLVERHLNLPANKPAVSVPGPSAPAAARPAKSETGASAEATVEQLTEVMNRFDFDHADEAQLRGALSKLESACAGLLIRCLKAGLMLYKKPGRDSGIHPAVKWLTADNAMPASKAYDVIKRIFRHDSTESEKYLDDPLLRQAHDKSRQGRPTRRTPEQ